MCILDEQMIFSEKKYFQFYSVCCIIISAKKSENFTRKEALHSFDAANKMRYSFSELQNPEFYSENRIPAHSDHRFFASTEEMLAGKTDLVFSLNGYWKFHHALNHSQVIDGFEKDECNCHCWADIPVPAHIQMEGYGHPQYANIQYPWDGYEAIEPGQLPQDFNPVASYVKYFYLPGSFDGKRVFISFQGAESCIALYLNG